MSQTPTAPDRQQLDERLSQRFIALDPAGYFLIRVDDQTEELVVEQHARQTDQKEFDLRGRILRAEIDRLNDIMNKAHFRNPKTGRIGKKGERFK